MAGELTSFWLARRRGVVGPLTLLSAARSAGVVLSTSIRSDDDIWAPGYRGFLINAVDEYISGLAFMPDFLMPSYGIIDTAPAQQFIQRAANDKKTVYIHCPCYASRWDKIASVKTAVLAGGLPVAKQVIDDTLNATLSVIGSDYSGYMDVVNEDVNGDGRITTWSVSAQFPSLLDFWSYCFTKARALFPKAKLFVCMNNIEEVSRSAYNQFSRYKFLGFLKQAKALNIPIDGVNLQGHCIDERGLVDGRFVDFLKELRTLFPLLRIGELDVRRTVNEGTTPVGTAAQNDVMVRDHMVALLDAALPYVNAGVGLWTLLDSDNSWDNGPNLENPCMFDRNGLAKPLTYVGVVNSLLSRVPATNFTVDPYRQLLENGTFDTDLKGWDQQIPTLDWLSGQMRFTSSGNNARAVQVIPGEPGQSVKLNLSRPMGTTSTEIRMSTTLSIGGAIADTTGSFANTTASATYPETTYVFPTNTYALGLITQAKVNTAGATTFLDSVSCQRVAI